MSCKRTEPTPADVQHIEACKAACTCPKSGPSAPTVGLVWQPAIIVGHLPRCPALELIWSRNNALAARANPFWEDPPRTTSKPQTCPHYEYHVMLRPGGPACTCGLRLPATTTTGDSKDG